MNGERLVVGETLADPEASNDPRDRDSVDESGTLPAMLEGESDSFFVRGVAQADLEGTDVLFLSAVWLGVSDLGSTISVALITARFSAAFLVIPPTGGK